MMLKNGQIVKVFINPKLDINIQDYLNWVRSLKEFQYIRVGQNMLVNLKIIYHMDMELLFGKTEISIMVSGKMDKAMVTELKYGIMEESI